MGSLSFGQPTQVQQAYQSSVTVTTAASGTITVPAGASVLRKVLIDVTENATIGVAGITRITVSCGSSTVYQGSIFLPASSSAVAGDPWHRNIPLDEIGFKATPGANASWVLTAPLTAGEMTINLYFS